MKKTYKIMPNGRINFKMLQNNFDEVIFYLRNGQVEFAPLYDASTIEENSITAIRKCYKHPNGCVSVAIPTFMRRACKLNNGDEIEITVKTDGNFVINKPTVACCFCGSANELTLINGNYICSKCLKKIRGEGR